MDRDPGRPSGGSRARTGGSARPVGDTGAGPARAGAVPPRPSAAPVPARPSTRRPAGAPDGGPGGASTAGAAAPPPSFRPAGAPTRPHAGPDPVPVVRTGGGRPGAAGGTGLADDRRPADPRHPADARGTAARPVPPRPAAYPAGAGGGSVVGSAPPAGPRPAGPASPRPGHAPGGTPPPALGSATGVPAGRRRRGRSTVLAAVLALLLVWPLGLLVWANSQITHVDVLTSSPDTPGITYLLAGSDSRGGEGGIAEDGTEGARTDTIMLLHVPPSGPPALISLPRDTLAEIPGQGENKLNAAYSWGGAPLLVETVEELTGLHVDHYVEVGLGGVAQVVDALGGVELCLDPAVNQVTFPLNDRDSGLVWEAPGCRVVDGATSLAYARMRKSDHEGDIGRAKRQQQLIAGLSSAAATPSLVVNPAKQVGMVSAGLGALQVSEGTNILHLGRLGLAFRAASGPDGVRGTPPIADADHRPGGIGSTVLLDPDTTPQFFADLMVGDLPPGTVGGVPAP